MFSKKLFALIAGCTILFSVIFLINTKEMVYLEQTRTQQPVTRSYSSPSSSAAFDYQAKPQYVKNLPTTVNPALFAEVERRLMNCEHIYNKTAGPIFLSKLRGEWKMPIREEWYMMMELIRCEAPFTFTRQSDGEYTIMTGRPIPNHTQAKILDRWEYAGGIGKLSVELQASLDSLPQNNGIIIHGVICPGNGWNHIHNYQVNATQQNTRFITHTYVFAGCNHMLTAKFMDEIVLTKQLKQPVIVIVNKECMAREKQILQWALDVYYLPDEFPTYYEEHGDMIMSTFASIAKAYTGVLFLMSGGPGMPPIQIAMSRANPWNQYVSFGSTLETWTKGYHSRGAITGFDPECHLKEGTSCVFRKNPVTGLSQTLDDYNEERKKLHMDTMNILNN